VKRLGGRHVLVTGASRGIGEALAVRLADEGAMLSLVARSAEPLEALAGRIGGHAFPTDLTAPGGVEGLLARVEAAAGPVDVLVNNAGVSKVGHLINRTAADIDEIVALNLLAPMQLCQQAIPLMLARSRGHIVNVSSLAGVMTAPGLVHYGASKAGLSHFTAGLRQDLRGMPIAVTLVQLGSVPTEMDAASRDYPPIRAVAERSKGRDITPLPEVADAITDAIVSRRRHVRLPRQLAPLPALVEIPRRLSERIFAKAPPGEDG
jgi:uncharacterized protein